ncbi:MAG TPA: hypothetical protein VI540_08480 [Gaiellaceae bacterium]|nr:hypothetical protein [Gaiellaceae bacterium]
MISRGESIEDYLRGLKEAPSARRQERYWQIPPYLQHLLWQAGRMDGGGFTRDPGNLQTLVNELLEVDSVLILTLNYDTLVESCLEVSGWVFASLYDYAKPGSTFSLVKLHGSVNWAFEVVPYGGPYFSPGTPEIGQILPFLDSARHNAGAWTTNDIVFRANPTLDAMRYEEGKLFYPALSAPLGVSDELTCPLEHVEAAKARLADMDSINLLIIGYSGHDAEVMDILRDRTKLLRQLTVVDVQPEYCEAVERLITPLYRGVQAVPERASGGFTEFVASGRLAEFFRDIR